MMPARSRQDDEPLSIGDVHGAILRAETLRSVDDSQSKAAKSEDRISIFWRLFGGTLLSIVALVCITMYQQINNAFVEMRNNINRLTESRADFVKTDDFNARQAALWATIKELQTANATLSGLKERSSLLEQQMKAGQDQLNNRMQAMCTALKDLDAASAAILALKERSTLLEQQVKTGEEERKELVREIQLLRERQAVVEGRQTAPVPHPATPKDAGR